MNRSAEYLNASEAASRLGVSAKALRLYEARGLIAPVRSETGWRAYGPDVMARAARIAALRGLGLSLGQVARVLDGDARELDQALAAHQIGLGEQSRQLSDAMEKVCRMRAELAEGGASAIDALVDLVAEPGGPHIAFDLPWPWGGERFELNNIRPLNFITGPLGSGKTRLARRIAEAMPDGAFLGLDRLDDDGAEALKRLDADTALRSRVDRALAWLVDEGATVTEALTVLVAELETERPAALVVDMPEQGLDAATQTAFVAFLRRRQKGARQLFLLTRSSAVLDLALVGRHEAILYCPANHSPPMLVAPFEGAPGYEAVATCLAPPDVRARTEGIIAWRPKVR